MCLTTKMKVPTIAEKDIICYKVISKDMSSLYHDDFKWEFGKMYTSWIEAFERRTNNDYTIHQAFHSYGTLEGLKEAYYMVTEPCLVVKCTIPSGSRFYRGKHDYIEGYASNQLIMNEVISIKELYPDFDWDKYPFKEGQMIKFKAFHDKKWENYQITNIQLSPISNYRVDLIAENGDTLNMVCIITKFDGVAWVTDWEWEK